MRKRSDRKRQAILDAASGLFREKGFERTSVSEICARTGGSKATIYNHFHSKEELFVECMLSLATNYLEAVFCDLQNPTDNVASTLRSFGKSFLRLVCSPEMVNARRLMIAEASRAGLGNLFYEKLMSIRQRVTSFISDVMDKGKLCRGDADLAAGQLLALLEMELFVPLLLCADIGRPYEQAVDYASERAVGFFLKAYARDSAPGQEYAEKKDERTPCTSRS